MQPELLKEQHIRCGDFKMLQIKMPGNKKDKRSIHGRSLYLVSYYFYVYLKLYITGFPPFCLVEKNTNFICIL